MATRHREVRLSAALLSVAADEATVRRHTYPAGDAALEAAAAAAAALRLTTDAYRCYGGRAR